MEDGFLSSWAFFCAILSFWDMVDYVSNSGNSELGKNLEDIFANLIQTLSSEAWVINPKTPGFQGRSPLQKNIRF